MTANKTSSSQEPFLNTVARKLGHAAGTLTNVAQELTDNISALPQAATNTVRSTARAVKASVGGKGAKKKAHPAKRRTQKTQAGRKRKPAAKKTARRKTAKKTADNKKS